MKNRIKFFKILSITTIILFFILSFTIIFFIPVENDNLYITCSIALIIFGILFAYGYYKLLIKINNLEHEDLKNKIKKVLSYDNLTEVLFCPISNNYKELIMSEILYRTDLKYFAKINENEIIEIFVKNQNDEEIYNFTIANYNFFNNHFEIKED